MKRFVLLLLLAVLPLQISWAAGVAHCPSEGADGVHSATDDASHARVHDTDEGDDADAAGPGIDCTAFHLVALEPAAAPVPSLWRAGASAADVTSSDYKSHIPSGRDRPKWRFVI